MNTLTDQISSQVDSGRQTIERSLAEIKQLDVRHMPPAVFVAGAVMATAIAAGVVWMVYRRRQRRTLVQRLQEALPDRVRDLPGVRKAL
ncbi:MAG TPA: hypothetical protein VJP81_08025 [Candidatus Dormibacteraeota bacterium]|nr:hypothetical protein [Candidatus Dormibacteraeota bacterium]